MNGATKYYKRQKLEKRRASLERRLTALQSRRYPGDELQSFHLGTVGASGKASRKLNARRIAALDRIIDDAVAIPRLTAALATTEAQLRQLDEPEKEPKAPRPARQPRQMTARETAIRDWYLYGDADTEPPTGLTDTELWNVRTRFCH